MSDTNGQLAVGSVDQALQKLELNNTDPAKDLLYYFEKGELLRLKNNLPDSTEAWLGGDEKIRLWEEEYKANPSKIAGDVGSFLVNDKTRRYDGYDYEKVMLSTRLAANYLAMGNLDASRIEIKKTHEREAVIAEIRGKQYDKVEDEAKAKSISTSYKDLNGYPVETLDDPEVVGLKNSYQSAFSHYLAGFVYEALREPGLAAPGYRKAIELRPNIKILEDGLKNVDTRNKKLKAGETDVLFVVESGTAAARKSMSIPVPLIWKGSTIITAISFPLIKPDPNVFVPGELRLNGRPTVPLSQITNIDAMSRRALKDDMPGIILRTVVRATAKAGLQKEVSNHAGLLGGLVVAAASIATEQADERGWRTLPSRISIGRSVLPSGHYTLSLATPTGMQNQEVDIAGRQTIVQIRLLGNAVYLAQPGIPSLVPSLAAAR